MLSAEVKSLQNLKKKINSAATFNINIKRIQTTYACQTHPGHLATFPNKIWLMHLLMLTTKLKLQLNAQIAAKRCLRWLQRPDFFLNNINLDKTHLT